jgi:hypothetical protein
MGRAGQVGVSAGPGGCWRDAGGEDGGGKEEKGGGLQDEADELRPS